VVLGRFYQKAKVDALSNSERGIKLASMVSHPVSIYWQP